MKMQNVNIEDAAHAIFFHPEYEEAVLQDLMEKAHVIEEVKEKIREYSIEMIAEEDNVDNQECIRQMLDYLYNLLIALKVKEVADGKYQRRA